MCSALITSYLSGGTGYSYILNVVIGDCQWMFSINSYVD